MVPAATRRLSPARLLVLGLALAMGGCTSLLEVQTLATGRSDVSAYALSGTDLEVLRREAQRMCPLGGEILRQSGRQQRPEQVDGRWRKALQATAQWIDPPQQTAQLVLLCREPGDGSRLRAAAAAPEAPAAASSVAPPQVSPANTPVQTTAALPIGPITPEW
ncbi:MAG: hypothetical protein V4795_10760 [Pseudomonadota bacterium]